MTKDTFVSELCRNVARWLFFAVVSAFFSLFWAGVLMAQAQNPILWSDVPDVSVLRVGETYYMASTTMHLNPGLPIMKSKDLINWELASYAYETHEDCDAMALRNGRNAYGSGTWASSLRYRDGIFYVATFSPTIGKTLIYTTENPDKTPWKLHAEIQPMFHDASLFLEDDGSAYLIGGAGNIVIRELTPDLKGYRSDGVNQVLIPDAWKIASPRSALAEGSQVFKVDGKYYVFIICWPPGGMRTVLVYRAENLLGPYEGRIALQDRGIAQGGIFDTPDGKWFAMLFRDAGAVGRIPYVLPVEWQDGWPILGVDGRVPDVLPLPPARHAIPPFIASDEFDAPNLSPAWQWNHLPVLEFVSLSKRPGFLRLTSSRIDDDFTQTQNTLTQRTFGPRCSGETCLDFSLLNDGDFAGLGLLQRDYACLAVRQREGQRALVLSAFMEGGVRELAEVPLPEGVSQIRLKAVCDFQDQRDIATFFYTLDPAGSEWIPIGSGIPMRYTLPHFMGYRFALFQFSTQNVGGSADFDWFQTKMVPEQ
ncbi:MAG: glycoside hydrolase 43 family protein [Planctomycetia bacterium]|nr:glycoside hydrolase 43 family protein [Planctomycetia bacterium]